MEQANQDRIRQELVDHTRKVQRLYTQLLQSQLTQLNLYVGQPFILRAIKELDGPTQKEIAERVDVTTSTLSISLKRMERAGLILRTADEMDQRQNHICLTSLGEETLQRCSQTLQQLHGFLVQDITEEEAQVILTVIKKIYCGLERYQQEFGGEEG